MRFFPEFAKAWARHLYLKRRFPHALIEPPVYFMWERRDTIRLDRKVWLNRTRLYSDTEIGDGTGINEGCEIQGYEGAPLKIGKQCSIACHCLITTANHPVTYPSTGNLPYAQDYDLIIKKSASAPVTIGNNVWMGFGSAVLPGVEVGDGAIIGAGAVVTKDVEPFTIVGGVPAKPIKKRFSDDVIGQMKRIKWWDWDEGKMRRNRRFFTTDLSAFKGDLEKLVVD